MGDLLKKLGQELYERVWVSNRSTILGIVLGGVVETANAVLLPYLNAQPQPWVHALSALLVIGLASLKNQAKVDAVAAAKAEAPKGFLDWEGLAFLSALSVVAVIGCATLRGSSYNLTATLSDGTQLNLTATDAGGCVASTGVWYSIPKQPVPIECNKVCVDVAPGAVVAGATCRIIGRPDTEFPVNVPIPLK